MQKRRHPRALTLTFPASEQPILLLGDKRFMLRNFSEQGIGIWLNEGVPFSLKSGSRVKAEIKMGSDLYAVELEVRHFENRMVGFRIIRAPEEMNSTFRKILEPATLASSMVHKPERGNEDTRTGYARLWYVAPEGKAELVLWYNEIARMVIALQACWAGKWVYRHQFQKAETGFLAEEGRVVLKGSVVSNEELLVRHNPASPLLLQQASQFLVACPPPLPGHLLWQFLETGEQVYLPTEMLEKLSASRKAG